MSNSISQFVQKSREAHPVRAAERRQNVASGANPWILGLTDRSSEGATDFHRFLRPRRRHPFQPTNRIWRSIKLVWVGPVTIKSPVARKKLHESFAWRYWSGFKPSSMARAYVPGSTRPPAASVGPSVPSVATLAKQEGATGRPAMAMAQAKAISWFLPPRPLPRTVTVVSPAAWMQAGGFIGFPEAPASRVIAAK